MTNYDLPRIRPAMPLDRAAIIEVNRRAWEAAYGHIFAPDEIKSLFEHRIMQKASWLARRDQRLETLVALHKNRIIGFIGLATLLDSDEAEVTTFYVDPDWQGRGVGKRLWEQAVGTLRDGNHRALWVWVLEKADARIFYEARGCVERERGTYTVGNHQEVAIGYYLRF